MTKAKPPHSKAEKSKPRRGEQAKERATSLDDDLEEALEESFPASDPPSMTRKETEIGRPSKSRRPEPEDE